MGSRLDQGSSKRRRRNNDYTETSSRPPRKQHLYLALDDWEGGYSIHKLDADNIFDDLGDGGEHKLPEPAAIRIKTPVYGRMIFTALGTNIFIDTNPHNRGNNAPPTFVYDTETAALTVGQRIPRGIDGLTTVMADSETLYALTTAHLPDLPCLQALSWARTTRDNKWDPSMDWSWKRLQPQPRCNGVDIVCYALHPDGHTIFMSTVKETHSFDTSNGVWKEFGNWVLPFIGQAFFDAELNAWVGIDLKGAGYVCCCCQVASRSATTRRPLECRVLKENLFRSNNEENYLDGGRHLETTLTYMGDSRFCLVENILCSKEAIDNTVLHVTFFGLKYDHMGELRTKVRRGTRSYAVSKNTDYFSHAAFWM